MHCFSGDQAFAARCIDLGFYLGVGGGERKSFKDVKSYKRRKRWLA